MARCATRAPDRPGECASVPRKDQRAKCDRYLPGLMLDGRRKSIQAMASRLPNGNDQNLQQFVNQSTWDPVPVRLSCRPARPFWRHIPGHPVQAVAVTPCPAQSELDAAGLRDDRGARFDSCRHPRDRRPVPQGPPTRRAHAPAGTHPGCRGGRHH
ncbi:transposase [Streptomyces phaeochromogenes]